MQRIFSLMIILCVAYNSYAQPNIYSALTIPDSLKKDAELVIRDESIKLSIKDKNTARYEVREVITLLNESAKEHLRFMQYSDKFHVLEDADIKLFDAMGNKKGSWSKNKTATSSNSSAVCSEDPRWINVPVSSV